MSDWGSYSVKSSVNIATSFILGPTWEPPARKHAIAPCVLLKILSCLWEDAGDATHSRDVKGADGWRNGRLFSTRGNRKAGRHSPNLVRNLVPDGVNLEILLNHLFFFFKINTCLSNPRMGGM